MSGVEDLAGYFQGEITREPEVSVDNLLRVVQETNRAFYMEVDRCFRKGAEHAKYDEEVIAELLEQHALVTQHFKRNFQY